jgi:hypothetical protein
MSANSYSDIAEHLGHKIEVAIYGQQDNAAIECADCYSVLVDFDKE